MEFETALHKLKTGCTVTHGDFYIKLSKDADGKPVFNYYNPKTKLGFTATGLDVYLLLSNEWGCIENKTE